MRIIDLAGPDGNAFALLGIAKNWAKQLGKNYEDIERRMTASDYGNLVDVFATEFKDVCEVYDVEGNLWN